MKKCKYCLTPVPNETQICPHCGARDFFALCANCGEQFESEFCPSCGVRAGDEGTVCPRCGQKSFGRFCTRCGLDLAAAPSVAPVRAVPVRAQRPAPSTGALSALLLVCNLFAPYLFSWFVLFLPDVKAWAKSGTVIYNFILAGLLLFFFLIALFFTDVPNKATGAVGILLLLLLLVPAPAAYLLVQAGKRRGQRRR